ncbi:hypothetical protein [Oscillatoria acuminata]|uniref:Uncharacterized protein n=1 Tax=Oscillatoria acuminata PCC 6304 TaxID=56110 RepID=K9TQC4_9CYAN|nr:hypothetical protein [Oscillatoria acuminata]AFY84750.1 hypothetical protein Oscil6304_5260 [Oscillatoria acuminata PCC 6304]
MMFNLESRDRLPHRRTIRRTPLALGVIAMFLVACQAPSPLNSEPEDLGPVASSEAIERTAQLLGKIITIRAEPVAQISPHSFTIQEDWVFGSEPILAINASGVPVIVPIDPQTPLQITGTMVRFIPVDIERAYGIQLDPRLYAQYEGEPAMIAQSITFSPEPAEVTNNPTRYYNHVLAVPGEVATRVATESFTLDASGAMGGNNLLAIAPNSPPLQPGQSILATGVLRPFVLAEIEREHPLTWDGNVRAQVAAEYRNQPVLMVDHIYHVPAITP